MWEPVDNECDDDDDVLKGHWNDGHVVNDATTRRQCLVGSSSRRTAEVAKDSLSIYIFGWCVSFECMG